MWTGTVFVEYNGLVLFAPDRLVEFHGGIVDGSDLFHRYMESDEGDEVLDRGLIVPVLAIDDAGYVVLVREEREAAQVPESDIVVQNGEYPFCVTKRAVVADLLALREWHAEVGWYDVQVRPGSYAVTVRGFRRKERGVILEAGYDFVLSARPELPRCTADTGAPMGVL